MAPSSLNILGLDVGEARIGLALANTIAKIPSPLAIIENGPNVNQKIASVINKENIATVVVGLPRNMKGEETAQSKISRVFASELAKYTPVKIVMADETLSSLKAEEKTQYSSLIKTKFKDDIAACYILEEYLSRL